MTGSRYAARRSCGGWADSDVNGPSACSNVPPLTTALSCATTESIDSACALSSSLAAADSSAVAAGDAFHRVDGLRHRGLVGQDFSPALTRGR